MHDLHRYMTNDIFFMKKVIFVNTELILWRGKNTQTNLYKANAM